MAEDFSIEKYLTDRLILESTLKQIEKDFEGSGIQFHSEGMAVTFDLLARQLKEKVSMLMSRNYESFLNLLYRIDLSETRLKRELRDQPEKEAALVIAEMIIKRELQKVVIRQYYRNRDNNVE